MKKHSQKLILQLLLCNIQTKMHFLADSAVSQQWLSTTQHEKMFTTINPITFYYTIYWLKCILKAAPENSERSGKISEHLNTHMGKGYKPVQKDFQNSQRS